MYGNALALMGVETGSAEAMAVKEGLELVNATVDVAAGGPQKRERAARYARDAAVAQKEAALAELEAAKVAAASASQSLAIAPMSAGVGAAPTLMQRLQGPSPIPGVPWWGLALGGAVAVWALLPNKGG